jgi:hypothetical protein
VGADNKPPPPALPVSDRRYALRISTRTFTNASLESVSDDDSVLSTAVEE